MGLAQRANLVGIVKVGRRASSMTVICAEWRGAQSYECTLPGNNIQQRISRSTAEAGSKFLRGEACSGVGQ